MIILKTRSKTLIATAVLAGTFSAFAATANATNFDGDSLNVPVGCVLGDSSALLKDDTYACNVLAVPPFVHESTLPIAIAANIDVVIENAPLTGVAALNVVLGEYSTLTVGGAGLVNTLGSVALGAGAELVGNVLAGTTVALGANAKVTGAVDANTGTTVSLGAGAEVTGDVTAGSTVSLGADAKVGGAVNAGTTITAGANASIAGPGLSSGTVATLGAGACVGGNLEVVTATLGASAYILGSVMGNTTSTFGADAKAWGDVSGTTATFGAGACALTYGTQTAGGVVIGITTKTGGNFGCNPSALPTTGSCGGTI
jgi:predicted acyltransferase (DUF342 family)